MFKSMETAIDASGILVYSIDLETNEIIYANKNAKDTFGNVVGKTCYKVLQKNQKNPCSFCPITNQLTTSFPHSLESTYQWANKNSLNNEHYMFISHITKSEDNRKVNMQLGINITKEKVLEEKILEEKDNFITFFKTLINSTLEGIMVYDENLNCFQTNTIAPKLLSYKNDEMINKYLFDFIAPSSFNLIKNIIHEHNQEVYEVELLTKKGLILPVNLRIKELTLLGKKIKIVAIIDISEEKRKEKMILELAQYDSLTKIANRSLFKKQLLTMAKRNRRSNSYGAILFIDLDHFKMVNDTKGHNIGDMVLIETTKRIQKVLRQTDLLSRLGGDEFIIALDLNQSNKEDVINNVNFVAEKILEEIKKPYLISSFDLRLTASIGIVLFKDENQKIEDLMSFADTAMYNAKENGKNKYSYFDPQLQQIIKEKADLTKCLRDAIENEKMAVYYQLQILTKNNQDKIIGVEALIRWKDKEKGIISPDQFIPLAEETALIIPLGNWIIKEVMKQLKEWENDSIKKDWRISINISYRQFEQENFLEILTSLIEEYKINPSKLRLELTENLLIKDTQNVLRKINHLHKMGITLSIDDFGTGYSSLAYLKQLSINELKIDQSFIRDLVVDPNDSIIVETMLSIGSKFNLEVIAEGVETKEQHSKLSSMGCNLFQGYLFGKPSLPKFL